MKSETLSETRQKFEVVKQGELSYVVVLDGEHIDEFTDESSANEYVDWFAAKLNAARLQGLEEAAKITEGAIPLWGDFSETVVTGLRYAAAAIREKANG